MKKLFFYLIILLIIPVVSSEPPELHPIEGFVFFQASQASNGFAVRINSLSTNDEINTITFGPPGNTGYYSTNTLLSTVNELIQVLAYNSTNYGINNGLVNNLSSGVTNINVTVNNTRPSELFVEIIDFSDNTYLSLNSNHELSVNITNIGYSLGSTCQVNISFSNINPIMALENSTTIPTINIYEDRIINFNLSAQNTGVTNIIINASCESDAINIENRNFDFVYNVEVLSQTPSFHPIEGFIFNSDGSMASSGITVIINSSVSGDGVSTLTGGPPGFSGYYSTNNLLAIDGETITVTAISGTSYGTNNGTSISLANGVTKINVTMNQTIYLGINILNITFDDGISSPENELVLNPGITSLVWCNFSVENSESYTKIINAESKIYYSITGDTGINNYNSYYSNNSCNLINGVGNLANYSCAFNVEHFANNGTWVCEVFVENDQNDNDTLTDNSVILPLFSFDLSSSTLDYGNLAPGTESSELNINITNSGNMNISMYLWTYGGDNPISGFNNSYVCNGNNITYNHHKYSWSSGINYDSKNDLYNTLTYTGVDLFKQTIFGINSTNSTYWQIKVPMTDPVISFGECNGTVVFEAFS